MDGVVESVRVEFDDMSVVSGAYEVDGIVGGVIVVNDEFVDELLVVLEHERKHVFFVPADGIIVDDGVMNAM